MLYGSKRPQKRELVCTAYVGLTVEPFAKARSSWARVIRDGRVVQYFGIYFYFMVPNDNF